MRILFVTMAPVERGPDAQPVSNYASARYRVITPAIQLMRAGHMCPIATLPAGPIPKEILDFPCEVLVMSKSFLPEHEVLVRKVLERGGRVVADYCDDHFQHPQYGAWYRDLAKLATEVVAATPAMAEAVRQHTGRDALVITDPVEGRRGEPKFAPRLPAVRLLWFGSPTNLVSVAAGAQALSDLAQHVPIDLTIVSELSPDLDRLVVDLAALDPARITARAQAWSLEATWNALEACDAVWIPVSADAKNAVKSPNRLTESIWAGRLVIADPMPAYLPFADVVPVGQGLNAAMRAALADPASVEAKLREAQRRVARLHSPYECGRQWLRAVGDNEVRPLRLNLGCGEKLLPGYVNVDIVESRKGKRPDVICDLHNLAPFDDGTVDEILSVHVVEHFWRWEIAAVLRDWVRVLKPGGRMIVECPNLQSACQTFLANPSESAHEDQRGQQTMWVFYGDPKWKDPFMIHRWGYTPESLQALLVQAGLRDVRQEPAEFKMREPRDMRVVGVKA